MGLDRLEASVREVRAERDSLSAQLVVFRERFKEEEDRLFRESADAGVEDIAGRVREELGFAETELRKLEEAFAAKDRAVIELEDDIHSRRARLDSVRSVVDEWLGLDQ